MNINKEKQTQLETLYDKWLSLTLWTALHAYLTMKSLKSSPQVVAEIFQVNLKEANEAIEGLRELGLLVKDGDFYRARKLNFILTGENFSRNKSVNCHILKSKDALLKTDTDNLKHGENTVVATNDTTMETFREEYIKLIDKLFSLSKPITSGNIYNITLNAIQISSMKSLKEAK